MKTYILKALCGNFQSEEMRDIGTADMQDYGGVLKLDAITLLGVVQHAIFEGRTVVLVKLKAEAAQ